MVGALVDETPPIRRLAACPVFSAEKPLEPALVPVDPGKREQHPEEYRMINPRRIARLRR
jgi:hypothetical protein